MIKILVVEEEFKPGFFNRLKSIFEKNEIYFKTDIFATTQIDYITVKQKKLSIPWEEIKSIWGGNVQNILCEETLKLPNNLGFSRFNESKFSELLCINSAKYVIQNLNSDPEKLKITLYDPFCEYNNILEDIIMFTRNLKVITNNIQDYQKNINHLADTYGVSIPVSNKLSWISPCNILIAPKIDTRFYTSSNTVIFTCRNYTAGLNGIIFNKYKLNVESSIKRFIPRKIASEYFIAALYSTNKFSKLDKIVPDACLSTNKFIPVNEISRFVSLN